MRAFFTTAARGLAWIPVPAQFARARHSRPSAPQVHGAVDLSRGAAA
ncbi:MAG TPA: hypothetical protein VLK84_13810 [Longimicrobium sp.]|nr:hypothetical protein [Longimicrobium sp.]